MFDSLYLTEYEKLCDRFFINLLNKKFIILISPLKSETI
jgi:hypothetical protein